MSALTVNLNSSLISTTTSVRTMLQYTAPTNTGAKISRMDFQPSGTDPAGAKGLIEIVKGATGGSGTTKNPVKNSGHTGSVQGTGKEDFSSEPTGGTVIHSQLLHPQDRFTYQVPTILNPGETLGIRVTFATSYPSRSSMVGEE